MKRTYPSGSEKLKILDNKTKYLNSLPKVSSFFGPASVKGLSMTAPAPQSQHTSPTTGGAANQNNGNENSFTQTDGDNYDHIDEQAPHDDNPTTETGEGDNPTTSTPDRATRIHRARFGSLANCCAIARDGICCETPQQLFIHPNRCQ